MSASFFIEDLELVAYNHWIVDCEWMVLILEEGERMAMLIVYARTPEEAVKKAARTYMMNWD